MPATLDLDELRSHIGRAQTSTDVIHAGPANLLRLALGRSEPEYREGDVLPPAWLALYFLPRVASDALRPDGSPRDTGVVPPLTLPRRMFAGERVRLHAAVRNGETLRRESRLGDGGRGLSGSRRARPADDHPAHRFRARPEFRPADRRLLDPGARAAVRHRAVRAARAADREWTRLGALGRDPRGHDRDERRGRARLAAREPRQQLGRRLVHLSEL